MKIRITESKLKQIVAESVKNILKENEDYTNIDWFKDRNKELKRLRNGEDPTNLSDYFAYEGRYGDAWENSEEDNFCFNEWCKMSEKLPGGGDQLDNLLQSRNPIFTKWYEKLHKAQENKHSWRLYQQYLDDINDYLEDEKDIALRTTNPFAENYPENWWDDDNFDYDGRHPDNETLHTDNSPNRELMNIDKQRKQTRK
jgi:hypothetical protein